MAASSKRSVCTTLERCCQFCNTHAYHLNLIANMFMSCFVISCILLFAVYISVQKPSKKQQKLLIQSCMQKLCRKPLCSNPVLFAEAVQSSCRSCALFLWMFVSFNSFGFSCLVISVHEMFISLFWDLMSTVFTCN